MMLPDVQFFTSVTVFHCIPGLVQYDPRNLVINA